MHRVAPTGRIRGTLVVVQKDLASASWQPPLLCDIVTPSARLLVVNSQNKVQHLHKQHDIWSDVTKRRKTTMGRQPTTLELPQQAVAGNADKEF